MLCFKRSIGRKAVHLSSKALNFGQPFNRLKFNKGNELQNHEFSDGGGLEMYDAHFRMYDPQLGIFHQIDKLADMSQNLSPYAYASDNPIIRNDPFGLQDTIVLQNVTVVAHSQHRGFTQPSLSLLQDDWRRHTDHLGVNTIRPRITPPTLIERITFLENSKQITEAGKKAAEDGKVMAEILRRLVAKGSLEEKLLIKLKNIASKGGGGATVALGLLDIAQGVIGEKSAGEVATSLVKLGFVYGVGAIGEMIGGPLGEFIFSSAAEVFLEKLSEVINSPAVPDVPGYQNIDFNLQYYFQK